MRLVCLSDTHILHRRIPEMPDGDALIHVGDCLGAGTLDDVRDLDDWLGSLPHAHKIVIAGNHDWAFQEAGEFARQALTQAIYLEDSGMEIDGLKFWGSPWTPTFLDWCFMQDRGAPIRTKWDLMPSEPDILITHGPPAGVGDEVATGFKAQNVGYKDLLQRIQIIRPQLHIFGHIHEGHGEYCHAGTRFVNASACRDSISQLFYILRCTRYEFS
ncbi:metallophosphatase domain-containing protein [Marinobacter bryozoorum]|uniref:metallophosphatase domain-containing protein n=1 Tax=Marinobacter bryozoorum TaxID=256324 RepID=UPI0020050092